MSKSDESGSVYTGPAYCNGCGRRHFMKLAAAAAGSGVIGAGAYKTDNLPIGTAKAVPPLALAAAPYVTTGAGAVIGYVVGGEVVDYFTGDDVDVDTEGYTSGDALADELFFRGRSMAGSDDSTWKIIHNHVNDSMNVALSKGKVEGIEAIEEGLPQSEAEANVTKVIEDYYTVFFENLINHWNEQVDKIEHIHDTLEEHSEAESADVLKYAESEDTGHVRLREFDHDTVPTEFETESYQLPNGDAVQVKKIVRDIREITLTENLVPVDTPCRIVVHSTEATIDVGYTPVDDIRASNEARQLLFGGSPEYDLTVGPEVFEQTESVFDDAITNITTWLDGAYEDVQSGDIDLTDYIDPFTFSQEYAADEDSHHAWAFSELTAIGAPVNLDGSGNVKLEDSNVTVEGVIGISDSDATVHPGVTYHPDDFDGLVYLAYDTMLGEGELSNSEYDGTIDGGLLTFTTAPLDNVIYQVDTVHDETVEVVQDDFERETDEQDEPIDEWVVDLSDDLEEVHADIVEIRMYASEDAESNSMILVTEEFTIESYEGSDGDELTELTFTSYNQQTTDVEFTEEELMKLLEARDGFDEYEIIMSGGGGLPFGLDWDLRSGAIVGGAAVVVGGAYSIITNAAAAHPVNRYRR